MAEQRYRPIRNPRTGKPGSYQVIDSGTGEILGVIGRREYQKRIGRPLPPEPAEKVKARRERAKEKKSRVVPGELKDGRHVVRVFHPNLKTIKRAIKSRHLRTNALQLAVKAHWCGKVGQSVWSTPYILVLAGKEQAELYEEGSEPKEEAIWFSAQRELKTSLLEVAERSTDAGDFVNRIMGGLECTGNGPYTGDALVEQIDFREVIRGQGFRFGTRR